MQLFLIALAFAAFFAYALWSSRLGRPGGHLGHAAFCGAWLYPFLGTLLGPTVPAHLRINHKEAGTTIASLLGYGSAAELAEKPANAADDHADQHDKQAGRDQNIQDRRQHLATPSPLGPCVQKRPRQKRRGPVAFQNSFSRS